MQFSTRAIHSGQEPEEKTGAVIPPIYMTTTYKQFKPAEHCGYEYTRAQNPNFTQLEKQLAALENAAYATVFSSGLGALSSFLSSLKTGDQIIAIEGIYGGTYRLLKRVFKSFGINCLFFPVQEIEKQLKKGPKWLLIETPTNPLLEILDIFKLVKCAKQVDIQVIVDNTFASPYFQNPLELGADLVWHSTTKYIGGHSDVIGGVMMTNQINLKQTLDFARMALGTNPSPFDTWLTSRGAKTLGLRMEKHQENALKIALFLTSHPKVTTVYYPGLKNHPNHLVAKQQMRGFSGMVSFILNEPFEIIKEKLGKFTLFTLAESLGGIESLICHPASMTHASLPENLREKLGISSQLIRLSVGIEDSEDLINDLKTFL